MRLILFLAILATCTSPAAADTIFGALGSGGPVISSPAPTLDHPRKVVLTLSERDPARVSEVIGNVGNIQKFYGADNVRIALIAYGPGVHAILKGSPYTERIQGLLAIGVHVLACKATLDTLHDTQQDVIPGVQLVTNGLPEVVELQLRGWTYLRP